jgi:hypothetical protein
MNEVAQALTPGSWLLWSWRLAVWAIPFAKRILPLMGIAAIALGG